MQNVRRLLKPGGFFAPNRFLARKCACQPRNLPGFGIRLAELFASSTLGTMAYLVGRKTDAVEKMMINWEWAIRPSPDLQIGTAGPEAAPAAHPEVILLTGCVGFWGGISLRASLTIGKLRRSFALPYASSISGLRPS